MLGILDDDEGHTNAHVSGLTLVGDGDLARARRYTKDLGTNVQVDYHIQTQQTNSGAPLLDENARWFAIHQRDLNRARCDQHTPWHPYLSENYSDRFAGDSPRDRNLAASQKPRCPPGETLPRQGSLLIDIAADIHGRTDAEWMCNNVPELLALHEQTLGVFPNCRAKSYKDTRARLELESR